MAEQIKIKDQIKIKLISHDNTERLLNDTV